MTIAERERFVGCRYGHKRPRACPVGRESRISTWIFVLDTCALNGSLSALALTSLAVRTKTPTVEPSACSKSCWILVLSASVSSRSLVKMTLSLPPDTCSSVRPSLWGAKTRSGFGTRRSSALPRSIVGCSAGDPWTARKRRFRAASRGSDTRRQRPRSNNGTPHVLASTPPRPSSALRRGPQTARAAFFFPSNFPRGALSRLVVCRFDRLVK